MNIAVKIYVAGIVQGVGFRPFIYNIAKRNKLVGQIYNNSKGVIIEAEGEKINVDKLIFAIKNEAPPLASIRELETEFINSTGLNDFFIKESKLAEDKLTLISPDISVCDDCLEELKNPEDRRFEYPFINCTNCGPRYTIIKDVPYDRPQTTMNVFQMCPECKKEYENPDNRRFHAQPIACKKCGPTLMLKDNKGKIISSENLIKKAVSLIKQGFILAIKGLGGYHLACDAQNTIAVRNLRKRKLRIDKPFAVMIPSIEWLDKLCIYTPKEKELLTDIRRPIVLIKRKKDCPVAVDVAPQNNYIGLMLPYTPLHKLIMESYNVPLVMTSANISEEPIAYQDDDAFERLKNIADYFLIHDREVYIRCDDSVAAVLGNKKTILRRARGYVPTPVELPFNVEKQVLAVGAHLKNTFCFLKNKYAFISHHIGDLENLPTMKSFKQGILHFKKIFDLNPELIVHDLHPDYLSTKYALDKKDCNKVAVQHHHAHIVSCMVENNLNEKVIGVAFDGTGLGTDGNIWGGEFLIADYFSFERFAHFEYFALPGGELAIKQPWRTAYSILYKLYNFNNGEISKERFDFLKDKNYEIVSRMLEKNINSPLTSAAGRLFDAVSALCDIRTEVNYEAQAAIELQMIADEKEKGSYKFDIINNNETNKVSFAKMISGIINDLKSDIPKSKISAKFHNTIARVILETAKLIHKQRGINKVILSGGVFQNSLLCDKTLTLLKKNNFEVFTHSNVPPNDGGISLGQAVIGYFKHFKNQRY